MLRIISNFRLKPSWVVGMTQVHFDITKPNRMGISYKCDLNRGQIDIQTVQTFIGEDKIEYVEKVANFRVLPNVMLFYYLTEENSHHTQINLKLSYSRIAMGSNLFFFYMRWRMKIFLGKSLLKLKELCEQMYQEHPR